MSFLFCTNICQAENQRQSQIILMNNHTQQVVKYASFMSTHSTNLSENLNNGFIMVKKSLHDQYLFECQRKNKKFVDQQFPPNQNSLFANNNKKIVDLNSSNRQIVWKRISQLYKNCGLIKGKIQPADIQQGNVGDCYFLAAVSALAQNPDNILQIFQKKNSESLKKNDLGIYKLIINRAGQPQQIIIDDYIPVYSKSQRPVFCKPVNNQFWVVLLQKAWAKINKNYANIASGNPHEVLNRFSVAPVYCRLIPSSHYQNGKRVNSLQLKKIEQNIWQNIMEGHKQNFSMCCGSRNKVFAEGIKQSHSYSLLAAYEIQSNGKQYRVLKIRNPWGNTQYIGSLNQNDKFWDSINPRLKQQILTSKQDDGVFIMPFQQFLINFQSIDILHCKPNYNYVFKQVNFDRGYESAKYFKLYVKQEGQVYITFQNNYVKNYETNQYVDNGITKILVAEQIDHGRFQCIDSALETTLSDVTVRCKKLKKGTYVVMVENQNNSNQKQNGFYPLKNTKRGTISAYSNTICDIQQIPQAKQYLFDFFYTHAVKYNEQKVKIGGYEKDWIGKKLVQQSGYGYVCINLDQRGAKRIQISVNQKLIVSQGFKIIFPQKQVIIKYVSPNQQQLILQMIPGQSLTFLFKIDFMRQELNINFPPKGFDIKKII